MLDRDRHWLAGFLEGEGSFMKPPPSSPNQPYITVQSTDEDVIQRAAELCGLKYQKVKNRHPEKWKQSYMLCVRGGKAVAWMKLLRPLMGKRRSSQIDRALESYDPDRNARYRCRIVLPSPKVLRRMHQKMSLRQIAVKYGCNHETVRKRMV